jgi:casein kinase 1
MPPIINNRFVLGKKLGKGAFGSVYIAFDKELNIKVALKMERKDLERTTLSHEYKIYSQLEGQTRVPNAIWYGESGQFNVLAMDYLGKSLDQISSTKGVPMKTVLMLGIQAIEILEFIHKKGILHRDIKPANFALDKKGKFLYLMDFGLAKRFKNNNVHLVLKTGKKMVGTPRYASINSHNGLELSRRDDLESLGYILIYFALGSLPWQNSQGKTKEEKYEDIRKKKIQTDIKDLCKELPDEFLLYMQYVRGLEYAQKPDYKYLRELFISLMQRKDWKFDYNYEWVSM